MLKFYNVENDFRDKLKYLGFDNYYKRFLV